MIAPRTRDHGSLRGAPRVVLSLFLLTAAAGGLAVLAEADARTSALHVLDIGQGDAILLRSGTADVLVDATISTRSR